MSFFHRKPAPVSFLEEMLIVFCSVWFLGGLYVDGWAHNHLDSSLETFFTPWHALFYSGYGVLALALFLLAWRRKQPKKSWREAIPAGYGWSLIGVGLFALGGIGDMTWHEVFGIEADIDALLSPTHLLLAVSFFLMITGPLRGWYLRAGSAKRTWREQLPMLFSVTAALSLITFMTQFAHFIDPHAAMPAVEDPWDDTMRARAIAGYLFQTFLLMGALFTMMRRAKLVPGTVTFLLTLNVLAMAYMRDGQASIPAAILAGIVGDLLLPSSYPVRGNERGFRLFAFVVPSFFFLCYFLTILWNGGTWWSVHLWTGSVVITGIAGLLLSYLVVPPRES